MHNNELDPLFTISRIYLKSKPVTPYFFIFLLHTERETGKIRKKFCAQILPKLKKVKISILENLHCIAFFKFRAYIPLLLMNIFFLPLEGLNLRRCLLNIRLILACKCDSWIWIKLWHELKNEDFFTNMTLEGQTSLFCSFVQVLQLVISKLHVLLECKWKSSFICLIERFFTLNCATATPKIPSVISN